MGMKGKPEERTEQGNIHEQELIEGNNKQALLIAELLEKSGQPFAVSDPDGSLGIYNPAFLELTGYSPEELKNIKWTSVPLTAPEWFESESKALAQLDSTGKPVRYQKEMIRKGGTRVSIELWANIKNDESGKPEYRYAFVTDITERKKAEETLKLQAELLNLESDAVYVLDLKGNIIYFNKAAYEIHGFTKEELLNMKLSDLDDLESSKLIAPRIKEIEEKGSAIFTVTHRHKNGSLIPMEVHASLVEINGKKMILSEDRDITERKKLEEELRLTTSQLQSTFESIGDLVTVQDRNLRVVMSNWHGREYVTEEERRSKPYCYICYMHRDKPCEICPTLEVFRTGQPVTTEVNNLYSDRILEVSAYPITDASGNVCLVTEDVKDITERKKAEEEVAHLASFPQLNPDSVIELSLSGSVIYSNPITYSLFPDLDSLGIRHPYLVDWQITVSQLMALGTDKLDREVQVGDSYYIQTIQYIESLKVIRIYGRNISERKHAEAENKQLREKAEMSSRLAAVGEMAAGIAHEINNPLTAVIGFSELLMEENLPQEMKAQLKIVSDGSHRVKDIVRRMLTFSRPTKPIKACVDINDLIDATLVLRSYVLRTANIEVVKHFDPDLHCVVADAGQLQQVFLNLIVNAEYSMKQAQGRGTLTITTEKIDDHVRILFKDDGTGISQDNKEKLFNPFFTTKGVDEGTGLGLSVSRSIILEHNGTIEVESEPGKGATFIITLPITEPLEEGETKTGSIAQIPTGNVRAARILVVDDEEPIRKLVSTILAKSGHTVETTGDAREALVKMDSTSYDVVLVDIRMPGMSGMELYNDVKPRRPEVAGRFIFITGDTSDENTRNFLDKNELSYLTKPFDKNMLIQKVNGILERE